MTSNQAIPSPKATSSFFGSSPRLFAGFSVMGSSEAESAAMSPTSILDSSKSITSFVNPFWSDKNTTPSRLSPQSSLEKKQFIDSKGVGLVGIVDSLDDEETNQKNAFKPETRMVLFGSQLKIKIPSSVQNSVLSPTGSPKSPADFGIKTRKFGLETPSSPLPIIGCLSASEMELSEDYTCVISRGPNPKTIRIFGDCIVENCCGVLDLSNSVPKKESENCITLSFCYNCKKQLSQGKDIYMYRGEKAFCSGDCRYQEMLLDEGTEKSDLEE